MNFTLSRWKAYLIVLLVWAGIYLPGLGRPELKGEEGRRVLSAVTMLENGNWVVPSVAGRDYYNKPPGLNWLIALSFALTGERSELTARLPSVVSILIFVLLLIWLPYPWLGLEGRLISALIFLTSIGIIDKGRRIEIEPVYISLTGIATLLWLYIWSVNGSKWLLWIVPSFVLGFGMLVKGPFILIFFYSVVISVLLYAGKLKDLFRVEHLIGVGIVLLMTGGWFYLAFQRTPASKITAQMTSQLLIRVIVKPDFINWGWNVARAFGSFLPWLLFVPMVWDKKLTSQIEQVYGTLFRSCRIGMVVGFAVINLMPGMFARYSLPVFPMASVLTGWMLSLHKDSVGSNRLWKMVLLVCFLISCLTAMAGVICVTNRTIGFVVLALAICATAMVFWKRNAVQSTLGLCLVTAVLVVVVMLQYSTFGLDIATSREMRRPAAMCVNKFVPAGQTVYIFNPSAVLPAVFYIRRPVKYLLDPNEINDQVHYLLLRKIDFEMLEAGGRISGRSPETLYEFTIPSEYRLVRLD